MRGLGAGILGWALCVGAAQAAAVPATTAAVPSAAAEAPVSAAAPQRAAHFAYVGVDYDFLTLSVDTSDKAPPLPDGHYHGRLIDFRAGYRVLKNLGVEAHVGVNASGAHGSRFGFARYYGVFAVPTATVLNTVELSLPVGFVWSGVRAAGARASLNSVALGANVELPLQVLWPSVPDLRLTAGGTVSIQRSNEQIYGYHVGLRYDFGLGNFAAVGRYFGF
ncbi:MAG TPA: hypothetical protein VFQ88_05140 [Nevskiaceae bacterium]|nr:hypothetical protein [Nevskiaceae bacterium]